MNNEILYKYRSSKNWDFLLDIFLNQRLHAAMYNELNDPMEGLYSYGNHIVSQTFTGIVRSQKKGWKICSLSKSYRNTLMWSYYAEGHKGIVLGVTIRRDRPDLYKIREVTYPAHIQLNSEQIRQAPEDVALDILSQKQSAWRHEHEVRVFTREEYVSVDIQQVILGCWTAERDCQLVTKLAKITAPKAEIFQLDRKRLDRPIDTFQPKDGHGNLFL